MSMLAFFCYTQKAALYPKIQGGIKINPFWKKGNALAAVSSIVVGGVVSLLCVFGILPIPVDAIIVGMSASFIDYVVVALVTGKKEG